MTQPASNPPLSNVQLELLKLYATGVSDETLLELKKTMAKFKGAVVVNTERCKGCDICVVACPSAVLSLSNEGSGRGGSRP